MSCVCQPVLEDPRQVIAAIVIGHEDAARDKLPVPCAIFVGQGMGVEKRIARVLVDDILEVVDQVAIPRSDRPLRRVENAASVAHRVVVARGPRVRRGVQQNELVPLAHDRPVDSATRGTRRQCKPLIRNAGRTIGCRRRFRANALRWHNRWHPATQRRAVVAVGKHLQTPKLQVVLEQPFSDLVAQRCDLAAQ